MPGSGVAVEVIETSLTKMLASPLTEVKPGESERVLASGGIEVDGLFGPSGGERVEGGNDGVVDGNRQRLFDAIRRHWRRRTSIRIGREGALKVWVADEEAMSS